MKKIFDSLIDIVTREDLTSRLNEGRPLRIKAGFDPTRPDLHLGHMVLLKKMREFQDLGHMVVLIVGDFTAMIGDPSGKNKARPRLSREEVAKNADTYTKQAFLVLDKSKTEIRFNSEWFDKMKTEQIFDLASKVTADQLLARRDFRLRLESRQDIFIHEIIYPVLQGYDSVAVKADIEIGGTDQLFNLLMGREMMSSWNLRPQSVITMPLLVGTDAVTENGQIVGAKMSKSLDNYIGLTEPAEAIREKILSLNKAIAMEYARLLSDDAELISSNSREEVMDVREKLASELIARLSVK
jgi:tyrosyl-tRNA synthetase